MISLPSLIESGIAEFREKWKEHWEKHCLEDHTYAEMQQFSEDFLTSFATKVHNNAIEAALEALPKEVPNGYEATKLGFGMAIEEARAKLSALKVQNI